jgi:hypothetical protein
VRRCSAGRGSCFATNMACACRLACPGGAGRDLWRLLANSHGLRLPPDMRASRGCRCAWGPQPRACPPAQPCGSCTPQRGPAAAGCRARQPPCPAAQGVEAA